MPRKTQEPIDPKKVEILAAKFWNYVEIASFFNCDESTIRKKYSDIVKKGKELGKGRLKDAQLAKALEGNATMLIWLGKQYLGQTEKVETVNTDLVDSKIEIVNTNSKTANRFKKYIHQ